MNELMKHRVDGWCSKIKDLHIRAYVMNLIGICDQLSCRMAEDTGMAEYTCSDSPCDYVQKAFEPIIEIMNLCVEMGQDLSKSGLDRVGCILMTPSEFSFAWNLNASNPEGNCEDDQGNTCKHVIHAEPQAIKYLIKGINHRYHRIDPRTRYTATSAIRSKPDELPELPSSWMFVKRRPCIVCADKILSTRIENLVFTDPQPEMAHILRLVEFGVRVFWVDGQQQVHQLSIRNWHQKLELMRKHLIRRGQKT